MQNQDKDNIRERLAELFRQVFDDSSITLFDEMCADDIDEWDSLNHITLVLAVEKEFNVQLNAAEVGNLANVGEMIGLLLDRALDSESGIV